MVMIAPSVTKYMAAGCLTSSNEALWVASSFFSKELLQSKVCLTTREMNNYNASNSGISSWPKALSSWRAVRGLNLPFVVNMPYFSSDVLLVVYCDWSGIMHDCALALVPHGIAGRSIHYCDLCSDGRFLRHRTHGSGI